MPFLAGDDHQRATAAKAGLRLPEALRETTSLPPARGEIGKLAPPLVRQGELPPGFGIERPQTFLQAFGIGADLAGEQVLLGQQEVVVIIVECYRHAIVGKHQEGERP